MTVRDNKARRISGPAWLRALLLCRFLALKVVAILCGKNQRATAALLDSLIKILQLAYDLLDDAVKPQHTKDHPISLHRYCV